MNVLGITTRCRLSVSFYEPGGGGGVLAQVETLDVQASRLKIAAIVSSRLTNPRARQRKDTLLAGFVQSVPGENATVKILSASNSLLIFLLFLTSCSTVMEANRPDPVDMSQFVVGEKRMSVLAEVGAPMATTKDGNNSCDVYKLYTEGHSTAGKVGIAAGEAIADVFTLGLAEVIFTPAQAATEDNKHAVIFCYAPDDKLISVNQSDNASGG